MSSVETGQMSAVETGQMSAAETGQMSSAETRQMYSIQTGQRPVAIVDICLVSAADRALVPEQIHACSQHTLLKSENPQLSQCHNVKL